MDPSRIATIPWFADLSGDDLAAVTAVVDEMTVPAGEAVMTEGDLGHALFLIESGLTDRRRTAIEARR